MTSRDEVKCEEVKCRYCEKPSTHKIPKKLRYSKYDKKTYNYVCDDIMCNTKYPDSDTKLRRFHFYTRNKYRKTLYNCIYEYRYNIYYLPIIALYIREHTISYDVLNFIYTSLKFDLSSQLVNGIIPQDCVIILKWIQDIIQQYWDNIKAEILDTNLYNMCDIIINYL